MPVTNTKENGLETLIVKWLVEHNGYEEGKNTDYSKEFAIDETRLFRFLQDTQPSQITLQQIYYNPTTVRTKSTRHWKYSLCSVLLVRPNPA